METWLHRPRLCITARCDRLDGKSYPSVHEYGPDTGKFQEDFKNWPLKLFTEANAGVRLCLRDLLQKKGIETKKGSGDSVPKILYEITKFGKADPIVPTSPIRPTTPTHPVNEAQPTQMTQQTFQQMVQQMQETMQQMTKLTVKQPTPRAPTPTRPTQDSDKNPTGTYKLTYVSTESDKSDTSMPDAASPLHQTSRRSVKEKDPDITVPDASPVAEEDPDITMPDAPTLRKSITRHGPCICSRFERLPRLWRSYTCTEYFSPTEQA
ncbi:hypothetical protein E4U27_008034 [Claviceps purpurea]|nr:hypothetical protein E4U27_008034 [Claviceps purpurea]